MWGTILMRKRKRLKPAILPTSEKRDSKAYPYWVRAEYFPSRKNQLLANTWTSPHWPRIGGLDFGWTHPSAAVELVWDRDADVVYVSRTHRLKEASPITHAAALRPWGKELRWSWPRDGNRQTLEGAGIALAAQYREQGLNLLHEFAHYVEGNGQKSVSVEAGLMDLLQRMESGRFKVFKHLNDWWEEFRLYHRKDGKAVAEGDDLMCATRYAIMSLRHASTVRSYQNFRRRLVYPKVGIA
jgi:Terminase RNaseH-like domain